MSGDARRAAVLATAALALLAFYVFSFVFAQATPEPHRLPVAIAGAGERPEAARAAVARAAPGAFDVRLRTEAQARSGLRDGDLYAALVLDGPTPRLLTAPALGPAGVRAAERRLPRAARVAEPPQVEIVRGLAAKDPDGSALDVSLLPPSILGILLPLMLTLAAPGLRVRERVVLLVAFALLAGVVAGVLAGPVLEALPAPVLGLMAVFAGMTLAIALTTAGLVAVVGPPGAAGGVLLFLAIGNVASGAQVPHELLPGFWRTVGPYLAPGAAADAIRSITYFDGADLLRPVLVLTGFTAAGGALSLALGERRPAGRGVPSGPTPDASPGPA